MATKPAPKKKAAAQPVASCSGPSKAQEMRWRAENDLRTMQQMAELKANPGRIRAAEAELNRQLKALQAVKGK